MDDDPLARALRVAARGPRGAAFARDGTVYVAIEPAECVTHDDPVRARDAFAEAVDAWASAGEGASPHAFGWLGYDALRSEEPGATHDARPRGDSAPRAYLARYDAVLAVPIASGAPRLWSRDPRAAARLVAAWDASAGADAPADETTLETVSDTDERAHGGSVEALREAIRCGDVYLVNLARMVHAPAGLTAAALSRRVARARAPYSALIDAGHVRIGGMSMELALAHDRATGALTSRPIKGTRSRGGTLAEDQRFAAELAADPKERAENVMAVDVHRNDLGRVARVGSVTVPALCAVEAHAFVHHLVSTVRAELAAGVTTRALMAAMLPVGSVTGAPKRSAMALIAQLEPAQRGVYTGVYGAVGRDGSLTLAVAIRTIVCDARGAHYGAGGGIVIDSDPALEWQELAWKERALRGG